MTALQRATEQAQASRGEGVEVHPIGGGGKKTGTKKGAGQEDRREADGLRRGAVSDSPDQAVAGVSTAADTI